jgi:hypothetical protein
MFNPYFSRMLMYHALRQPFFSSNPYHYDTVPPMTKEKLIEMIQRLLKTDIDLNFLLQLKKIELETLLACIRHEVGQ